MQGRSTWVANVPTHTHKFLNSKKNWKKLYLREKVPKHLLPKFPKYFLNFPNIFCQDMLNITTTLLTLEGICDSFPTTCLEQLFFRIHASSSFCMKEFHSRHYLNNFLLFQNS